MPTSRRSFLRTVTAILLRLANPLRVEAQTATPADTPPASAPPAEPVVEPVPFVPGSWTIAVLPDTQHYTTGKFAHHFDNQTRWIGENAKKYNIAYVRHLGDIVNNNETTQWEVAQKAMRTLDGVVPYALATGNHDHGPGGNCSVRETMLHDYFRYERGRAQPTYPPALLH